MRGESQTMPNRKATLLIVDDDHLLRKTLVAILAGCGYGVRSAEDGFSALAELRNGTPDIILSDLNMPGMSGFELLSVVRRRFPGIQVIAMSAAYSGALVPLGVAAEAFYEKGTNVAALLRVVQAMRLPERPQPVRPHSASAPLWIATSGCDPSGRPYAIIPCPECLRTFARVLGEDACSILETDCVYCHTMIYYAIDQPLPPSQHSQDVSGSALLRL
jgi:CheY-like chemotaxis protein